MYRGSVNLSAKHTGVNAHTHTCIHTYILGNTCDGIYVVHTGLTTQTGTYTHIPPVLVMDVAGPVVIRA